MKDFKQYDCGLSIGLMLFCTILYFLEGPVYFGPMILIEGYFIVGAWQVISMFVHAFKHCFTERNGVRYVYHWISFLAVITLPASYVILYFIAPFMALFYTGLCIYEVQKMKRRPLDVLK